MAEKLANTQNIVDVEEFKSGTVILKDGSLRQIIMVSGVNFSLKSAEEQGIITLAYQNFLNSVDFPLQIMIHSRKLNIEKYLADLDRRGEEEKSPILQSQIREYREFIGSFVKDNAIMEKTFFVVVPWHPITLSVGGSGRFLSSLPFLKKDKAKEAEAAEQGAAKKAATFEENLAQLKQRVGQVVEGLSSVGLETLVLNDEQLVELFYNLYNPGVVEKKDVAETKE